MDSSQDQDNLARRSTDQLIAADRVTGTSVFDSNNERIGTIDRVMIDKYTGKVAYAVMSFGGFLGIGERYHPLPWDVLDYDTNLGGYNVGVAGAGLKDAPNYERDDIDKWDDTSAVDSYYSGAKRTGYGSRGTTPHESVGSDHYGDGQKAPGGMMSGATSNAGGGSTGGFTGQPGAGTLGTGAAGGSSTVGARVTAPSGITSSGGPTGGSYGTGTGDSSGRAGHEPSGRVDDPTGQI
jgi:hypothetical protein